MTKIETGKVAGVTSGFMNPPLINSRATQKLSRAHIVPSLLSAERMTRQAMRACRASLLVRSQNPKVSRSLVGWLHFADDTPGGAMPADPQTWLELLTPFDLIVG